jgi:hypothetical protein
MTYPETSDLWLNVKNNNNIAWKNVSITDLNPFAPGVPPPPVLGQNNTTVLVAGDKFSGKPGKNTHLKFLVPKEEPAGRNIYAFANIHIDLGQFLEPWMANGMKGKGFVIEVLKVPVYITKDEYVFVEKTLLRLELPDAYIEGIDLDPTTIGPIGVMVTQNLDYLNKVPLHLDVVQVAQDGRDIVGGENFEFILLDKAPEQTKKTMSNEAIRSFDNTLKVTLGVDVSSKLIKANLATDEINGTYHIEIWDADGKQLVNKTTAGKIEVDGSGWAKGIYVVRIMNVNTRKFTVKRIQL